MSKLLKNESAFYRPIFFVDNVLWEILNEPNFPTVLGNGKFYLKILLGKGRKFKGKKIIYSFIHFYSINI